MPVGTADFSRDEILRDFENSRNPANQGAPDTAIPRFHKHPIYAEKKSEEEGRPIYIEKDYVEIIIPGIDRDRPNMPVSQQHKDRWPAQWAAYEAGQTDAPVEGTPLKLCALFRPAWIATLKAMNCHTVEAFVNLPDEANRKVGPVEYPSGVEGLRAEARKWLSVRGLADEKDKEIKVLKSQLVQRDERIKELEKENEKLEQVKFEAEVHLVGEKKLVETLSGQLGEMEKKLKAKPSRAPRKNGRLASKKSAKTNQEKGERPGLESSDNGPEHRERDGVS